MFWHENMLHVHVHMYVFGVLCMCVGKIRFYVCYFFALSCVFVIAVTHVKLLVLKTALSLRLL